MKTNELTDIGKIMSKRHGAFIENFTIFFSYKIGNALEFKLDKF